MRILQPVLMIASVVLLAHPAASAEEVKNLQALIDKAQAGAEVKVPKGEWTEPIKIDKPLKLIGEDRAACVIDVTSDEPAIRFGHGKGEAVLENVTVRWKLATSNRSSEPQAAIVAKDGKVRLRNVRVAAGAENFARCPSGLTAHGFADVKIDACEFEGFEFTLQFGGGATAAIADCLVSNPGHCGITAGPESTVNVTGTIVTGSRYHALRCTGGELNAKNNLVIANKNRGFYLGNKSARGTIKDNVIQDNGSGISAFAESAVKVQNNFIAGSEFAAIDMRDSCRLTVERNLFVKNARGLVLFPETGKDRNTIGRNASAANPIETEKFAKPPDLVKVEGEVAEGEFAMEKAKGFGLTDPAKIKPVWDRWTALRKTAAAE